MVVRTAVEIKPDERKRLVERELSNFMKREHEFIARERRERAAQLGLALYSFRRDTPNVAPELQREDVVGRPSRVSIAGDRPGE